MGFGGVVIAALINGVLTGGVYSLTAVGLTLIWGVMGISNFAHGSFLMVGMYITYWGTTLLGIDPYIGCLISMAVMFVVGWLVQKYLVERMMDLPHYNQMLLFLGLSIVIENSALFFWPDYKQLQVSYQFNLIPFGNFTSLELVRVIAFAIAVSLTTGVYLFLKFTSLGKSIRATSQNVFAAKVVGINIKKINCVTFAIGIACAAGAGAVITPFFPTYYSVGSLFLLTGYVVTCLGGMGNLAGAMVGGLIIGVAESLGTIILPGGQKQLLTYGIFLLLLVFKPKGLFKFAGYWQSH
ncbi:Amino acid/amide ABC transporter membrane protein 1, HAAT family [uncultured Spirochaetota bacterium]|jgi:branched-chain amino acid transport system permease protein|nr:Amino acid/amide ABC transporter membrane protein 1, HAAT family [uncultured Spirochaetota bacterium]